MAQVQLQSFDKELWQIMNTGQGLTDKKVQLEEGNEYHTIEQLNEMQKDAIGRNPVTKPNESNDYEKQYAKKVMQPKAIGMAVSYQNAVETIKRTARQKQGKKVIPPMCDYQTAKYLVFEAYKSIAQKRGFEPVFSKGLKEVLPLLVAYFTGNKTECLDSNRGIYLWGACGTGKSIVFEVIQHVLTQVKYPMRFATSRVPEIFDKAATEGEVSFSKHYYGHRYFDDIGFDGGTLKHFGNKINPMQIILTNRYNRFQGNGILTHVSSNLPWTNPDSPQNCLSVRFDDRIASRGSEMWNFIVLRGEDFRRV